ncbi:MAG: ethanolamine utilization protein EutH [Firmicutes bacterium]|nr:ethanolamine utilization protein EutH [Bacillota bacterium]
MCRASFCLGDHLAFTASVEKAVIPGLIVAQLLSGILAVIVAMAFMKKPNSKMEK